MTRKSKCPVLDSYQIRHSQLTLSYEQSRYDRSNTLHVRVPSGIPSGRNPIYYLLRQYGWIETMPRSNGRPEKSDSIYWTLTPLPDSPLLSFGARPTSSTQRPNSQPRGPRAQVLVPTVPTQPGVPGTGKSGEDPVVTQSPRPRPRPTVLGCSVPPCRALHAYIPSL